jgi:hypothetical protein
MNKCLSSNGSTLNTFYIADSAFLRFLKMALTP